MWSSPLQALKTASEAPEVEFCSKIFGHATHFCLSSAFSSPYSLGCGSEINKSIAFTHCIGKFGLYMELMELKNRTSVDFNQQKPGIVGIPPGWKSHLLVAERTIVSGWIPPNCENSIVSLEWAEFEHSSCFKISPFSEPQHQLSSYGIPDEFKAVFFVFLPQTAF